MEKNEQEWQDKKKRHDEIQAQLSAVKEKILSISTWAEVIRKHIHSNDLDRAAVDELIDHIEIGESIYTDGIRRQEVKVFYRFVGLIG